MSSFAIKYPFFILMMCLFVIVVGVTTVVHMPVDLFPEVTFLWWWWRHSSGMPPQQIESGHHQ